MKLIIAALLVFVAATAAGPISISDNNVGDIVTVGINANATLSNKIDQNIISIIVGILNQQLIGIGLPRPDRPTPGQTPKIQITPEMKELMRKN